LQDSLTVEPAPLLLGRAFGEEAKDDGRTNS